MRGTSAWGGSSAQLSVLETLKVSKQIKVWGHITDAWSVSYLL